MLLLITLLYLWATITIFAIVITSSRISILDVLLIILWPIILPIGLLFVLIEWLKK